ncbi:hypothetical protein SteCoe_4983 [Stentor coeruleus]|uniref:Uncharacterized protein n=1 Tax=Stentor coeruleus TaxID=5963 RepID=A0A1R2CTN6_9CILI|nr:hypothetical protein SteCoe_4983 [Stentor coeruleus]
MLAKFLSRFFGTPIPMKIPKKYIISRSLDVMTPQIPLNVNKYIVFKHYTGNEILYTLKDVDKLKPGEISSALLELGLRKGISETYDWMTHPCLNKTIEYIKSRSGQYTSRVLTSIAKALHRLRIKDQEVWDVLKKDILRTITSIEPIGLAYCFSSFVNKGYKIFYEELLLILPVHIFHMNPQDILNIMKGLEIEGIPADDIYKEHIYPTIKEKINDFNIAQLNILKADLEKRSDFPEEIKALIEKMVNRKINKRNVLTFGGGMKYSIKSKSLQSALDKNP